MSNDKENVKALYELLVEVDNVENMELLMSDLCTYKEIESMAQRVKAAKMLMEGKTYEEIIRETNISSATLSRVSKCVKYSKGYKTVIK